MLKWLWLSVLIIVLDQVTKHWVEASLVYHQLVPVIDGFFSLTLTYNEGAALSFLADAGGWQRWFFILLAVLIVAVLVVWLKRLPRTAAWTALALALIIGGAIGNVIDRLVLGHVIDFLLFYYQQWAWPAFNLADSAITVGAIIFVVDSLLQDRRQKQGDA